MKWLIIMFLGALWCFDATAATYAFRSTTYAWESANTNVVWDRTQTGYPNDDDKQVVNLGFTFNFGGVNYTQVRIHANGVLQFGADTQFHRHYENTNLPVTTPPPSPNCSNCTPGTQPDRLLLVYWDDINPALGGTVRYQTKGTGPNRRFVVSWENVPHFNFGGQYSFQIILFENGEFVYQYGTGNASGVSATIGVEIDNSDFTLYSFNSNFSYAGTAIRWFKPSGAPTRLAEYWFEEQNWSGRPNEVVDWTGNGYAGNTLGAVQSVVDGRVCRAASIPLNTNQTVAGINTNIDVDSAIGNSGSISFWYRGNTSWNTRDNQLFDATSASNAWFHLTKRSNGRLLFRVADTQGNIIAAETGNYSFAAGVWKHIAVSWRVAAGTNQTILRIYLDGVLVQSQQGTTNGQLPASLGTLFFGDNPNNISQSNASTVNSADGLLDEIKVYNYEISSSDVIADRDASHPCISIDHLRIEHDGQGLTCDAETVVIKACLNDTCSNLFPGYVPVDFQLSGGFYGTTLLTAGQGNYSFNRTQAGNVTLGATTSLSTVNATRCFIGSTANCVMQFTDVGVLLNELQSGTTVFPDGHAGNTYQGRLRVVRTNTTTGACETRLTGAQNVDFAVECNNPQSCVSGQQFVVNNTAVALNNAGATLNRTAVNLNFNNQGAADFSYRYSDVGRIRFHVRLVLPEDISGPALTLQTSSSSFVIKPHTIQFLEASANPYIAGSNPGSMASGVGFWPAERPFQVLAESRNAQGARTPNFGREQPIQRITLDFVERLYPVAGIGGAGLFESGLFEPVTGESGRQRSVTARWREVGTIRVRARLADNNYLNAGDVLATGVSPAIGRFYPVGFRLASSQVSNSCGAFSYMQQPGIQLSYELEAVGDEGRVLQNYDSSRYQGVAQLAVVAKDLFAGETPGLGGRLQITPSSWVDGRYQVLQSDVSFNRAGNQQPDGPFRQLQLGIQPLLEIDNRPILLADFNPSVTGPCTSNCPAKVLGATLDIRYGRLVLDNAFGSELESLPLSLRAEYWDGQRFSFNSLDQCSAIDPALLQHVSGATQSQVNGYQSVLQNGISSPLALLLAAPGEAGSARYRYQAPPWLTYDWTQTGSFNLHPQNEVIFGRYRGNPRQIFWRER